MARRGTPSRNSTRTTRAFVRFGLVVVLAVAPAVVYAKGKKPKKTDGPYNVSIRGSYTGEGRAEVNGNKVSINAQVKDEYGADGALVGGNLKIDGDHFEGAGTVFGRSVTITGRLDGYDGDKHFRGARILCNFVETSGQRAGRIAGVLQ